MAKIWATLFASAGDKQVIPVPPDAGGAVSVTQGWTPDYELPNTDPNYKPVGREEMNGVINEVTDSIQQLQLQGAAEWSALLLPYPKGADVIYGGERYRSLIAGNSDTPGATANWSIAGSVTLGIYSGNSVVTTGQTFTIADVGKAIEINAAGATTHTLPAASAYASGKAISFANINTGIATFNRAGSDTITGGNLAAATAIPLNNGEAVTLVSDGASKWYVAASNVTFFGAPQTWQDVTATRVVGTTYTNSTGRKISINVSGSNASNSTTRVTVNGVLIEGSASSAATSACFVTADIPSGATYVVGSNAGTFIKGIWAELR